MTDARAIAAHRGLPGVAKFPSWTTFDQPDAMSRRADLDPDTPGTWFQLVILERAIPLVIGDLALRTLADDPNQTELGINLAPARQGRGYAAEAIRRLLADLFDVQAKHGVIAVTDAANTMAARLFHRIGFQQEAHFIDHNRFKGAYGSEFLFAMLANDRLPAENAMQGFPLGP